MTVVRHFWTLLFLQRLHSATSSPLYWPYTIPSRHSRCPPLSQNNLSSFQISHLYHHHLSVKRTPKVNIFFSPFLLQRKHSPPPTSIDNRSPTFPKAYLPSSPSLNPPSNPPYPDSNPAVNYPSHLGHSTPSRPPANSRAVPHGWWTHDYQRSTSGTIVHSPHLQFSHGMCPCKCHLELATGRARRGSRWRGRSCCRGETVLVSVLSFGRRNGGRTQCLMTVWGDTRAVWATYLRLTVRYNGW